MAIGIFRIVEMGQGISNSTEEDNLRQELASLSALAGGMAHEIRNPLSTISLNLDVLQEELQPQGNVRDARMLSRVIAIQNEVARLEKFLGDVLQYNRGIELEKRVVDLSEVAEQFLDFQRPAFQRAGVNASVHFKADLPAVALDVAHFRRALLNLTLNAIQALPEGGTIEFQTFVDGDRVCLAIIDNGPGIPASQQEKLFDLFFSTKQGGSGLGLPTVRKIVQAHGGEIRCESEPDRGTRFLISLPTAVSE